MRKYLSFLATGIICLALPVQALAFDATLGFEAQVLDLDTGIVSEQIPGHLDGTDGADIRMAYNADRIPHAVIMTLGEGTTLAVMSNTNYDVVTAADVAGLSYLAEAIDQPLEATDTVVVKTDAGATFKLGNAIEDDAGVTFSYELLQ